MIVCGCKHHEEEAPSNGPGTRSKLSFVRPYSKVEGIERARKLRTLWAMTEPPRGRKDGHLISLLLRKQQL